MALLYLDGFDSYGTTNNAAPAPLDYFKSRWMYNGTDPTVITDGRTGSCMRFKGSSQIAYGPHCDTSNNVVILGTAFRLESVSTSNPIIGAYANTTRQFAIEHVNDEIRYKRSNITLNTTSGLLLQVDTWYYLEVKVTIDNSSGEYEVKLDGSTILSDTGIDTQGGTVNYASIIAIENSGVGYVDYDDLYFLDGTGSVNNDFLGQLAVKTLRPDGDDTTDFSVTTGVNHYDQVNEEEANTSKYVETGTVGHQDIFTFGNTTETDIKGIQVVTDVLNVDFGGRNLNHIVETGNQVKSSTNQVVPSNSLLACIETFDQDPDDSANWNQSKLNAAKFGVEVF
jgi:hypothetical protein